MIKLKNDSNKVIFPHETSMLKALITARSPKLSKDEPPRYLDGNFLRTAYTVACVPN